MSLPPSDDSAPSSDDSARSSGDQAPASDDRIPSADSETSLNAVPGAAATWRPDDEAAWATIRGQWNLRGDTVYLNHGSFGPPPRAVQEARERWRRKLDEQPMDFFVRQLEPAWLAARARLAEFLETEPERLVFVENATMGMNIVAQSFPLQPGDQVLLNNHEYGAVQRIWQRVCERAGAELRVAQLPNPLESAEQIIESLAREISPRTRLLVVSHVTSPTALIMPVRRIVELARQREVAVCVDGPHAPVQVPVQLDPLDCDFYTASCHKWMCAPFGSGFLYVSPRHQERLEPALLSWGRGPSEERRDWSDEFLWTGTRDPSAYLAVPAAIEFFERIGLPAFRARSHYLARQARHHLDRLTGRRSLVPDDPAWYGSMALAALPRVPPKPLQRQLWERHRIEVPIIDFEGGTYVRVSCHLYNTPEDIERLVAALRAEGIFTRGHSSA